MMHKRAYHTKLFMTCWLMAPGTWQCGCLFTASTGSSKDVLGAAEFTVRGQRATSVDDCVTWR